MRDILTDNVDEIRSVLEEINTFYDDGYDEFREVERWNDATTPISRAISYMTNGRSTVISDDTLDEITILSGDGGGYATDEETAAFKYLNAIGMLNVVKTANQSYYDHELTLKDGGTNGKSNS